MRSKSLTAIACLTAFATAAPPATAEHKRGHHYCESAKAGAYRQLHTYNLSCRKGTALMKAFERRNGEPTPQTYSDRINGYRCTGTFRFHAEGVTYGEIVCRKGKRKAAFYGTSSNPGSGAGPG